MKLQDVKIMDQMTGHENAGHETTHIKEHDIVKLAQMRQTFEAE